MSDAVIYLPFLVIALVAVFAAFSLRGKEIPDWVVGVTAPIAGFVFLFVALRRAVRAGSDRHWRRRLVSLLEQT
jgi:hypothetical protein